LLHNITADKAYQVLRVNPGDGQSIVVAHLSQYSGFDRTPDGQLLMAGDGRGMSFWDAATGDLLYQIADHGFSAGDSPISPDGRELALIGSGANTIARWAIVEGATPRPTLPDVSDAVALVQPTVSALFTLPAGL
jgi:WD40 repeat protein